MSADPPQQSSNLENEGTRYRPSTGVRIPDEEEAKIISLVNVLPDDVFARLDEALRKVEPRIGDTKYASDVAHFNDYEEYNVHEFLGALLSISYVRLRNNSTAFGVAADIAHQLFADYSLIEQTDVTKCATRLTTLLSAPNLEITSKALIVSSTGDKIYQHCTIISNLTPIFGSRGQEDSILASIIRHDLCLELTNESAPRKINVLLDELDLISLRDVVERAIAKNETLKKHCKSTKTRIVSY
jgi:hypothetical protein